MSTAEKASKKEKDASISATFLPKEIIFEIFARLPPKSLIRFRCVSKYFNSLVADPFFLDVHRDRSFIRPDRISILISFPSQTDPTVFYTIDRTQDNNGNLQFNRIRYLDGKSFYLESSANGLLCLSNIHRNLTAVNLCTRQHISLPPSNYPSGNYTSWGGATLGFDSVTKTYKVLKSEYYTGEMETKHWILTLGVDKSWRKVNCLPPFSTIIPFSGSVHINGVVYSICYTGPRFIIVAFDLVAEIFSAIPSSELRGLTSSFTSLVEMDGRLGVINCRRVGSIKSIDVWNLENSMGWKKHTGLPFNWKMTKSSVKVIVGCGKSPTSVGFAK